MLPAPHPISTATPGAALWAGLPAPLKRSTRAGLPYHPSSLGCTSPNPTGPGGVRGPGDPHGQSSFEPAGGMSIAPES